MLLNHTDMNIFDIITAIVLAVALFAGWRKGFITQLFSLLGILGGIFISLSYGEAVGAFFGIGEAYAKVMGFIITFITTAVAATLLARVLTSIFSAIGLGSIDTLLGIVLSAIKYVLLLSVLFVTIERLNNNLGWIDSHHFEESKSFRPIATAISTAQGWFDKVTEVDIDIDNKG